MRTRTHVLALLALALVATTGCYETPYYETEFTNGRESIPVVAWVPVARGAARPTAPVRFRHHVSGVVVGQNTVAAERHELGNYDWFKVTAVITVPKSRWGTYLGRYYTDISASVPHPDGGTYWLQSFTNATAATDFANRIASGASLDSAILTGTNLGEMSILLRLYATTWN